MTAQRYTPTLTGLSSVRYRCFRDRQEVDLGRLTLVYGENNSGKSALVRLPALLADARKPRTEGLNPDSAPLGGFGPRAALWRGSLDPSEDRDLILGVRLSSGAAWEWTLEWRDEARELRISRFTMRLPNTEPLVFNRFGFSKGLQGSTVFEGPQGPLTFNFDGLIPPADIHPGETEAREELLTLLSGVSWLTSARKGPPGHGQPIGRSGTIWNDGAGTADLALSNPRLLAAASAFFADSSAIEVVRVSAGVELERLMLRRLDAPDYDVAFPEAGSGFQHAFPVVMALANLRYNGGFLIVEEPEAHLHPRLQRKLAEHMVDVLVDHPTASVLLETHSEIFLIAALGAAIDRLPGKVRLQWIEQLAGGVSTVEPIPLDASGRPTTPAMEHAFDTMGVMRRELIERRRQRAG